MSCHSVCAFKQLLLKTLLMTLLFWKERHFSKPACSSRQNANLTIFFLVFIWNFCLYAFKKDLRLPQKYHISQFWSYLFHKSYVVNIILYEKLFHCMTNFIMLSEEGHPCEFELVTWSVPSVYMKGSTAFGLTRSRFENLLTTVHVNDKIKNATSVPHLQYSH